VVHSCIVETFIEVGFESNQRKMQRWKKIVVVVVAAEEGGFESCFVRRRR